MINWFRIQIESYIEHKRFLKIRNQTCDSCEVLKIELSKAHDLNKVLLEKLTEKPGSIIEKPAPPITPNRFAPPSVIRIRMEAESRRIAQSIKDNKNKEIDELENELLGKTSNA